MSNKTYAEHLEGEFQTVFQDHLKTLDREMISNAALIKRLKEQEAARKTVPTTTKLPEQDSALSSTIIKL